MNIAAKYSDNNFKHFTKQGYQGALPRRTKYGYDDAYGLGLTPIHEVEALDVLAWEDVKEAIEESHTKKMQPIYHQHNTWAPPGFRSNQNGLPFCWTWSLAATFLDLRAMEAKDTVMLAPVSMGWLVDWREQGYYLDDSIRGLRERGMAPVTSIGGDFNSINRNPSSYQSNWKEQALNYRLEEVWDTDTRKNDKYTIQQAATILTAGRPCYMAINSMSHAMMITGIWWDESEYLNIEWGVRNSHNEPDIIRTSGSRWIPDEIYGFASSKLRS